MGEIDMFTIQYLHSHQYQNLKLIFSNLHYHNTLHRGHAMHNLSGYRKYENIYFDKNPKSL